MKKHLLFLAFMCLGLAGQANENSNHFLDSICHVDILVDSTGANMLLTADASGTTPYTYLWSTGETTQSVIWSPNINYCVTIADANGCTATDCLNNQPLFCEVSVQVTPSGALYADAYGTAPFLYSWNTGELTQSITPAGPGLYCVTITDADGCTSSSCYQVTGNQPCEVTIEMDSTQTGANLVVLTANATGEAPFTFQWNVQNWQSQSVTVAPTGNFCVTITDASGCTATDCINFGSNACFVNIEEADSFGIHILYPAAYSGTPPYTFQWSTGEVSQHITPTDEGQYCITMTDANGCVATDCFFYDQYVGYEINGIVVLEDSSLTTQLEGIVELFKFDDLTGTTLELVATTDIETNANGATAGFYFGPLDVGGYLVRVTLDPNNPAYDDYLPTYHISSLLWNEADVISIPANPSWFIVIMNDGMFLTGPGGIEGQVTNGDGFTSHGGDDRGNGGDPLANVTVLLLNDQEEPVAHALTDANGEYAFDNLPLGTYKVVVEIPGLEQGIRWVTLTQEEPQSENVNFEVNETGIVNNVFNWVGQDGLTTYPNPVTDHLFIQLESKREFGARLAISDLTGVKLLSMEQNLVKGQQQITWNVQGLPSGIYFLELTDGRKTISRKIVKL